MVDAGIPLWRAAAFVNTLHPDVIGSSFIWQAGSGVKVTAAKYEILETDEYRRSPVVAVYATRQPIRRRLADGARPDDFPVLHDLWAEGATDYVAFPLPFTDGTVHVATWTTRQPGGFTDQQFADLEAVIAPLTRVVEIRALRRTAMNLLNTYVGRQAGERILAGKIRRGFVEEIRAAIWLSDMRGFTALSERLPPQELVDLLNRYFDCQVPPILQRGGEVLKFIGDGLLAIFPLTEGDDPQEVCQRAFSCALDAHRRIDALERAKRRTDPLRTCAPHRPGDVRQYRRRQPARFHLRRTGGEPRGTAGEARGAARPGHRRLSGFRRTPAGTVHPARRMHRRRLQPRRRRCSA